MRLHYLQHVPFEDLAYIREWAIKQGFRISKTAFYENEPLPEVEDIDVLVVLGGPMNIYQENEYPWLTKEKMFIKKAIEAKKKVLGVCLGAQLIADVLGAAVVSGEHKEIGWFPLEVVNNAVCVLEGVNSSFVGFHWHGDTFAIPSGAIRLMASEACHNQAFIYAKNVLALQFHIEMTKESIQRLIDNCKDELVKGKYIQNKEAIVSGIENYVQENNNMMDCLLNNFIKGESR